MVKNSEADMKGIEWLEEGLRSHGSTGSGCIIISKNGILPHVEGTVLSKNIMDAIPEETTDISIRHVVTRDSLKTLELSCYYEDKCEFIHILSYFSVFPTYIESATGFLYKAKLLTNRFNRDKHKKKRVITGLGDLKDLSDMGIGRYILDSKNTGHTLDLINSLNRCNRIPGDEYQLVSSTGYTFTRREILWWIATVIVLLILF